MNEACLRQPEGGKLTVTHLQFRPQTCRKLVKFKTNPLYIRYNSKIRYILKVKNRF